MRNMLAVVGALVVGFAGVGWYMGWYKLHVSKAPDGNLRVETDVDTKKVVSDSGDALKQVGAFVGEKLDKAGQDAKAGRQPGPPVATPGPTVPPTGTAQPTDAGGGWLFGPNFTPSGGMR